MGKPWLKLWTEIRRDRKLLRVSTSWRWCWIGLLTLAAETDNGGRLELAPGVPLTNADLAAELSVSLDEWTAAAAYFRQLNMLSCDDRGCYILTNYAKRQATADPTGADRQQRWRQKHLATPHAAGRGATANALSNAVTDTVSNTVTSNGTGSVTGTEGLRVEAEAEVEVEAELNTTTTAAAPPLPAAGSPAGPNGLAPFTAIAAHKVAAICGPISATTAARELEEIAAQLYQAGRTEWLDGALDEAVALNKRNWRYVRAILRRCLQDHQPPGAECTTVPGAPARPDRPARVAGETAGRNAVPRLTPALEAARRVALRQQNEENNGN